MYTSKRSYRRLKCDESITSLGFDSIIFPVPFLEEDLVSVYHVGRHEIDLLGRDVRRLEKQTLKVRCSIRTKKQKKSGKRVLYRMRCPIYVDFSCSDLISI